jgi:hypothetical protein
MNSTPIRAASARASSIVHPAQLAGCRILSVLRWIERDPDFAGPPEIRDSWVGHLLDIDHNTLVFAFVHIPASV